MSDTVTDEQKRVLIAEDRLRRFMAKVVKTESCWEWKGATNGRGYGQFWDGSRNIPAHWFLLERRPDTSKGEEGCHHCDNRKCVRPDHIFVGTRSDNMLDCSRKGRLRHCLAVNRHNRKVWHRGVNNHACKLTEEQAMAALNCPRTRGSATRMAKDFGVSLTVICDIRDGKRWTHISQRCEAFGKVKGLWL